MCYSVFAFTTAGAAAIFGLLKAVISSPLSAMTVTLFFSFFTTLYIGIYSQTAQPKFTELASLKPAAQHYVNP